MINCQSSSFSGQIMIVDQSTENVDFFQITVKMTPSQKCPELVKTSPKNWSKCPHGKKCCSKRPKNDFSFYILCIFRHNLGCLKKLFR